MSDGSALLPQPLTVQGQLVAGGLTIVGPNSPYVADAEAVANNGISTLFLNREFWLPTPAGTDITSTLVAADAAATLVNGVVRFKSGASNYQYSAQITKTARWLGGGSGAALQCTAALGTGVRSILDNYQTGQQADLALGAPSMEKIRLLGPGTAPVPTAPTKTAGVDGVQLNGKLLYRDVVVEGFDSNIVLHSAFGHIQMWNVVSTKGYYNVYQELGNQDHLFAGCDFTGAAFAGFAAPGNVAVQRVTFFRTHFGYEPFCYYQEANGAATTFLWDVQIIACPHELVGNSMIFSENIAQANAAGFAGDTEIHDPSFSFSNTYKITAKPQDWAINVGDVRGSVEIRNGSNRLVNGSSGAVQAATSEGVWNIHGDATADVYTIPTHPEWVNRWGSSNTPVLGRIGTQRQTIGDSAQISDLVITDSTAIAGFTLTGSGGTKALRNNGTTMEWLNSALAAVIMSLTDAGQLLVKDLRLTRQVPTEAVLVSGVDPTLGGFIGTVTLTAARVVGAPLTAVSGQRITFELLQNGTGGWAVTWNAIFKTAFSNTGNTAGLRTVVSFVYDNFNWVQDPIAVNAWV